MNKGNNMNLVERVLGLNENANHLEDALEALIWKFAQQQNKQLSKQQLRKIIPNMLTWITMNDIPMVKSSYNRIQTDLSRAFDVKIVGQENKLNSAVIPRLSMMFDDKIGTYKIIKRILDKHLTIDDAYKTNYGYFISGLVKNVNARLTYNIELVPESGDTYLMVVSRFEVINTPEISKYMEEGIRQAIEYKLNNKRGIVYGIDGIDAN